MKKIKDILYSVVIPVYNGEYTLEELTKRLVSFFESKRYSFEIIFVFDCGPDNSWEVIKKLENENNCIKAIKLTRNFGQHNAIICGIKYAQGEFIITMDEDLQQDPSEIEKLINQQKKMNSDVVYGTPIKAKHTKFRNLTSRFLKKLLKWAIPDLHPDYSAYRLLKKNIAKLMLSMNNSYTFLDGYLSWITKNISSIKVNHYERKKGKSSYSLKKLIAHSINIFVTFSHVPIRFITYSSFLIFIMTIIYSGVIVYQRLAGQIDIPGYASLIIAIGLGIGFVLFGLGIVGEYIYRINQKTAKRPLFLEEELL